MEIAYRPQSSGMVEGTNWTLRETLSRWILETGWVLAPSQNSGAYMLYIISTSCLKFCFLVVLNQLQKPGHFPIQCW